MTREEMQKVQPAQEYIRKLQQKRNAGTEDCMLSTDLARELGINAPDLHHFLIDVGFLADHGDKPVPMIPFLINLTQLSQAPLVL